MRNLFCVKSNHRMQLSGEGVLSTVSGPWPAWHSPHGNFPRLEPRCVWVWLHHVSHELLCVFQQQQELRVDPLTLKLLILKPSQELYVQGNEVYVELHLSSYYRAVAPTTRLTHEASGTSCTSLYSYTISQNCLIRVSMSPPMSLCV